jgi:tape measure domain-containing protein
VKNLISAGLVLVLSVPLVWAQLPDAPTVDKKFIAVAATEGAAQAIDGWYTAKIAGQPGMRELNPLLGPHPSVARIIGTSAGIYAGEIFLNYELKKRKSFKKLWWIPALGVTTVHTIAAVHNSRY